MGCPRCFNQLLSVMLFATDDADEAWPGCASSVDTGRVPIDAAGGFGVAVRVRQGRRV